MDFFSSGQEGYDWISAIFSNVTQVSQGRELMLDKSHRYIDILLSHLDHRSPVRRKGVAGAIKNCLFDYNCHQRLIDENEILVKLLWPLRGPEHYKPNELEGLPTILASVDETKEMEHEVEIRGLLVECLILLSSTQHGRETLRKMNAYQVLKYYDLVEENEVVSERIFSLVNILEGLSEDPNRAVILDPLKMSTSGFQSSPFAEDPTQITGKRLKIDHDEIGEIIEVI